ncbi:MAG: TRAM domain-containing protein [Jatrophihabitantaceae bacterium]
MSRSHPTGQPTWLGQRLELTIGPVAHGGHCVARHDGRVLFVRHCLPGELVLAEVTEDRGGSFCRADAVEILRPSPDRVPARCEYAHPGGCGGCDFQHVSLAGQRALKAAVVREQLQRLAGLEREVEVLSLPAGSTEGLGWRRRIRFAVGPTGELGLHSHRSDRVVPVRHCPLGAPGVGDATALDRRWTGYQAIEVATDDRGAIATVGLREQAGTGRGRSRPKLLAEQLPGASELHYRVAGRDFALAPAGFWQTHPAAAAAFTELVLAGADPQPGERALDLYAGAGLFTAALAGAVGSTGRVIAVEGDRAASRAATANLADLGQVSVRQAALSAGLVGSLVAELRPDVVVLDPPRTGAGGQLISAILAGRPRVVVYVACDPAALARDLATAGALGWNLAELTAIDAFPMTHHVECVAVLRQQEPVG